MTDPLSEPTNAHGSAASTLSGFLGLLARRKWIVIASVVLAVLAALVLSLSQGKRYEASAEVLLNRENLAASLTGSTDVQAIQDAARFDQTQADVARARSLARSTLDAAGFPKRPTSTFLKDSSVAAQLDSDILRFTATDEHRGAAVRLATEYARQFTRYRRRLDTAPIVQALMDVQSRLSQLRRAGERNSDLYKALTDKAQQLRTLEALKTQTATLLNPAESAVQVRPRPLRNSVLGLLIGIVLGLGLAHARDRLDTRVRSADEVTEGLGLPLLARVPEPSKQFRGAEDLVVLNQPASPEAEAFRMLRTNLDFANLDRGAQTIMVTSALEKEGKSTTVANLAVAFARAGKTVSLVDLDFHRPAVARFFRIENGPGITDVALGGIQVSDALHSIALTGIGSRDGIPSSKGTLQVLPSGTKPPDPGEFLATNALSTILHGLRQESDLVLIDAPPLLLLGDAMTLSAKVDAIFLVTRLNVIRRPALHELRRLLASSPAAKLGFVLTAADREGRYGYASYY
jgi:capsular exopolysaccharide synthesis family protein